MSSNKDSQVTVSFQHTGFVERAGAETGFIGVAVLRALLDYANHDTRLCWPSVGTLCTRTALSENSVLKGLRLLREHGFIKTSQRMEKGRQTTNEYEIMDRELVAHEAPLVMIRILKVIGFSASDRAAARRGEGARRAPHELNDVESKAKGVKATALDLASGLRPSTKSRHEPAADAGGYVRPGAGSPNGSGHAHDEAKPKPRSAFKRTARGWWIPVEPVFCQQRRNTNGAKAKTTATSKTKATAKTTATSKAQTTAKTTATSKASAPPPPKPPAPRAAGRAAAGAEPRSVADPSQDTPDTSKGPQRQRQRAPRPTDPFFNLFGELVLGGQPTTRDRGLAGEFASRCVANRVTERALRDWRAYLTHTGEVKFLRPYNAWAMFLPWWEKRIGKYVETPGQLSDIERSGGAGSFERWAHIRYGIPAER